MTLNLKLNTPALLALVAFQIAYGVVVFVITRDIYSSDSAAAAMPSGSYQIGSQKSPHGLPKTSSGDGTALLTGSERFTVNDAMQMVATSGAGNDVGDMAASERAMEELARTADRHFTDGRFEEAADEYTRLLEQAPHSIDIYNNLGLTLHYIDRNQEAIRHIEKGIALDATHQRIWLTLGFVQGSMGEVDAARRAYSKAVELDPKSQVGREASRLLNELPG